MDTSVQFAENLSVHTEFLELNQAFAPLELSYIQSWSFDDLSIDMDPNDLLNHCMARGLQLPNKTFDVSFLRMFQFDQNFFQKMMHVMPNLTRLIARGCNWSPALAKLLEDGLSR